MPGELITDTTSPSTADAVCGPPAPGPERVTSGDRLGFERDRVERADRPPPAGCPPYRKHGNTRTLAPPSQALRDAEQLQHEPELLRVVEVVGRDLLDAVERDVVELHRRMEREPREDRHLGGGILAVHVLGRVGLGVTELLRAARARPHRTRRSGPSR